MSWKLSIAIQTLSRTPQVGPRKLFVIVCNEWRRGGKGREDMGQKRKQIFIAKYSYYYNKKTTTVTVNTTAADTTTTSTNIDDHE